MANANTIGPATRINGQIETDEDLTVEGRIEGGPVRVRGRLTVAARGIVLSEDTEVRDALVVGVFVGTLRAQDVVRIHQDGRIVGDVVAPRVVFVSDKPTSGAPARPAPQSAPPSSAAAPRAAQPAAPHPEATGEAVAANAPAAAPAEAAAGEARTIPPLPNLGQRSAQRKE